MTPEKFKQLGKHVTANITDPLGQRLNQAQKEVGELKESLQRYNKLVTFCQYLTNGETTCGWGAATMGMFVSGYRAQPAKAGDRRTQAELIEVDLVIIPEVLVPHVLRVNIPNTSRPGTSTSTATEVDVLGIIARMKKHARNAKNVATGTFADVLREPCATCDQQALVIGIDKYIDDDNGYVFTVDRLCEACSLVENIASFYKCDPTNQQYGLTNEIYREPG